MKNILESKHLKLRLVTEDDANFILKLRGNNNLNKYLSKGVITEEDQKKWIRKYKEREEKKEEFYFRIDKKDGEELGFVRIYNIDYDKETFTWGSWIIKEGRPPYSAIESALIIYEYAFYGLKMKKAVFEVMKENEGVIKFHNRFGAVKISEDNINEYFELTKEKYEEEKIKRYEKFLEE